MLSSSVQEIQHLKSSQKQTLTTHTGNEVLLLNGALEEMEEVKTQRSNIKQINKVSRRLLYFSWYPLFFVFFFIKII